MGNSKSDSDATWRSDPSSAKGAKKQIGKDRKEASQDEPPADPADRTVDVSDAAELMAALEAATGGETIRLAPGNYGTLSLDAALFSRADFEPPVTIVSSDPENAATLEGLNLRGVGGLIFENLVFDYDAAPGAPLYDSPFLITNDAHDITIRNSVFDGDLAEGLGEIDDGHGTGKGLVVRDATAITLEGNEFFDWHRAATFDNASDLILFGNEVHSIRSDGFNFAAVQGVLIEGNHFHDFDGAAGSADHRDMIQFWTAGTDQPSSDIVIRGNLLMSGSGDFTQSIFLGNEAVESGGAGPEMYYRNVLIEDNVIWNAHLHGITLGATDGLTIVNNTLLHNLASGDGTGSEPRINVSAASLAVTITHNIAAGVPDAQPGWTVADNLTVQRDSPSLPHYYGDLFVNALNDSLAGIEDLQALPGGLIETGGYGAELTRYDPTPTALTALAWHEKVSGEASLFTFDAGYSAGPDGPLGAGDAQFLWDFGDGTSAEGITVSHDYASPGIYVVALEVVAADGTSDTTRSRVEVADPLLLEIGVENGDLRDASSYAVPVDDEALVFVDGRSGGEAVEIDADSGFALERSDTEHIFDLEAFSLSFGFRALAAGEVLSIHTALHIDLETDGRLSVGLTNAAEETSALRSSRGLLDDGWHDVTLTFDGVDGDLRLFVDGVEDATTDASGRTQPMEFWDLFVGGGGWREGFAGAIDSLEFRSNELEPSEIADQHGMSSSEMDWL